jgi:hypothetical protein
MGKGVTLATNHQDSGFEFPRHSFSEGGMRFYIFWTQQYG